MATQHLNGGGRGDSTPSPGFESYIPAGASVPEFTARALIAGILLGVVFGASSLYLVLKVGLTVSASIPVAVISLTLFKLLSKVGVKDASILENNITQTAGSAGESIAFGVGVTMPAILILGFDLELTRVMMVAVLGGLLGILMMIPLRRALIVREHGKLKYPEGTACAEVLKAGASAACRAAASPAARLETRQAEAEGRGGNLSARTIFTGFGLGLAYKTLMVAGKGWKEVSEYTFGRFFRGASAGTEVSPELVGVGYIIGPRIASIMCAGGVLAYLVLIPLIKFFGDSIVGPLDPGKIPIRDMGPSAIRNAYILYIGAGAVAAGGIFSMIRSLPTIWHGLQVGLQDLRRSRTGGGGELPRTDQDISMKYVVIGIFALLGAIMLVPSLHMNLLGALLVVFFGFLFVTVSSRLTGEIGSSSNPISGMTVATLLLTCLVFLLVGWTGGTYFVTALSIGGIVCVAASNGGTTSQDLKTGFLVGGTPRLQQYAILCGALASALALGPILMKLNQAATVYVPAAQVAPGVRTNLTGSVVLERLQGPQAKNDTNTYRVWHNTNPQLAPEGKYLVDGQGAVAWLVDPGINGNFSERPDGTKVQKFTAPKATLMSYIIKGILDRKLPWALVLLGVMIAVTLELCAVSSLAFAVGVYLPLASSAPIFIGGMVRWLVDLRARRRAPYAGLSEEQFSAEADKSPGVLLASGYIAGGAIAGIIIAFMSGAMVTTTVAIETWSSAHNAFFSEAAWNGHQADLLTLIPFVLLVGYLFLTARKMGR
jgi:putative OPT family oligopeptide transporter